MAGTTVTNAFTSWNPSRTQFAWSLVLLVLLGAALRVSFPLADPPWTGTVGVVWHDEGAWTHNARNLALFGTWKLDEWNPMYITPVFTSLEYVSFRLFGVGLWQARLLSELLGSASILLLGLGVSRVGGRLAGLVAAAFLATNYVYVMYDRAALMEATMIAFVVAAWYAYARAEASPRWGFVAGAAAILAYFTKASAIFFLAALALDALLTLVLARWPRSIGGDLPSPSSPQAAGAGFTLAGLALSGAAALAFFVLPNWAEYRFYNWQMSVTRKPSYTLRALADRISWFPIVHDFFTRMWGPTVLATLAVLNLPTRLRHVKPAERVLALWVLLGAAELILHDVGNERRLVFLIPAIVALAALLLTRDRQLLSEGVSRLGRLPALAWFPVVAASLYLVLGSVIRLHALYQVRPGVRWSAAAALAVAVFIHVTWPLVPRRLAAMRWGTGTVIVAASILLIADVVQFGYFAATRTYKNYEAMIALGRLLPPGTLVHGKLANGLALENEIKPVFVGRGFGNFADRANRPDIRYLVTYVRPSFGFESQHRNPVVLDILETAPQWKVVQEFDVAETSAGNDRAALIDKYPTR